MALSERDLDPFYRFGFKKYLDNTHPHPPRHEVKLVELTSHQVFYEKLIFSFLEMPKFNKRKWSLKPILTKRI